jgi:hypothetical protein
MIFLARLATIIAKHRCEKKCLQNFNCIFMYFKILVSKLNLQEIKMKHDMYVALVSAPLC